MNVKTAPQYVPGHGLLKGRSVLITAAAGVGIGFAAATRAAEEGCRGLVISDVHPGRLEQSVAQLKAETGLESVWGQVCRSEEHTSELQSRGHLVCRLLLEKKNNKDGTRAAEVRP